MQLFLYEFITGGGLWSLGEMPPQGSLLAEGAAMAVAVANDLAAIEGVDVTVLCDTRLEAARLQYSPRVRRIPVASADEERFQFERHCRASDRAWLIAPESDGILCERIDWAMVSEGNLISPNRDFAEVAADKQRTAETLAAAGVKTPRGCLWTGGEKISFPAVVKPNDGCGSQDIRRVFMAVELAALAPRGKRVEEEVRGTAASVAVLCGMDEVFPLPACRQHLSDDGRFTYLGGSLPLSAAENARAQSLAVAAVKSLRMTRGYVGVDVVLGETDYVIEINPRLTTSYVGLRRACRQNLAEWILKVATLDFDAADLAAMSFAPDEIKFAADGTILT